MNAPVSRFSSGGLLVGMRKVYGARELITALVRRDLIVRYEHAVLGIAWALAVPLMQMGIFVVVFTQVAPLRTDIPYPLYAYAGLATWTFFASAVRAATRSLSDQAALVTKVYFPREVLPLAAVIVSLVDFAVALVPLAVLMVWYGIRPTWGLLGVPLVIGALAVFTTGLSLALAMANLFYRDVRHVVEVMLLLGMFATSVVYPADRIGGTLGRVLALNPLTPIIGAFRSLILGGPPPSVTALVWSSAAAVGILLLAWSLFYRVEHLIAELA
jgi:ABC-type polysaccharide/polyol phosphate export permease